MQSLNTHTWVKRCIATGMSEELAEEVVKVLEEAREQSNLVTKDDLRIAILELKTDIGKIDSTLKAVLAIMILVLGMFVLDVVKTTFYDKSNHQQINQSEEVK